MLSFTPCFVCQNKKKKNKPDIPTLPKKKEKLEETQIYEEIKLVQLPYFDLALFSSFLSLSSC